MPNIQPLPETLHLHSLVVFSLQIGTNPNLMVFDKSNVDMGIMTWCKWSSSILFFFDGTLQLWNATGLIAQNNPSLGSCLVGDIFIVVHYKYALNSSITSLLLIGPFGW